MEDSTRSSVQDPIQADEFVLRRIHRSHCNLSLVPPILPAGFRPSKADTTGLSVYRAKYLSPVQVATVGRKPGEYYVVRLSVETLRALNLTVVLDELAQGPPGHALIPELGLTAYEQYKEILKPVLVELARLASSAVVHQPDSTP